MILPTQDKELKQEIRMTIYSQITPISEIGGEQLIESIDRMCDKILKDFEKRGYHIGLPQSIEEALNSGDGTYHP